MHFPDERPDGGAPARAVEGELMTWRSRRGPDWAELMARADGARRQGLAVGAVAAIALAAAVAGGVAATALHHLPGGLEAVRDRLLP